MIIWQIAENCPAGKAGSAEAPPAVRVAAMTKQPAELTINSRLRLLRNPILLAVVTLFWTSLYTYPSILSPYLKDLGASLTATGLVISSYGLTQTILRIPAGILSDRLRNKRSFVIAGMILSLLSAAGLFFSQDIWLILLFRGLAGAAAAMWVHISTLYMSYHSADKAAEALGKLSFCNNAGSMAAMLAGSAVAQLWGWKYAFLLAVVIAVPGLALSLAVQEDKPDAASQTAPLQLRDILAIGRDRTLFWTAVLALLSQLVNFATTQGFVPQFASNLGATKAQLGLLSAFALLPRALAALLGGNFLARWFKLRYLVIFGFVLTSAATCALPLINNLPLLFADQFVSGVGSGFQITLLMAMCTQTIPLNRKASAMGFFQAVYGIGMVVGPTLIGLLADWFSLGTGFVIIGLVSLLTAGLTALVLRVD